MVARPAPHEVRLLGRTAGQSTDPLAPARSRSAPRSGELGRTSADVGRARGHPRYRGGATSTATRVQSRGGTAGASWAVFPVRSRGCTVPLPLMTAGLRDPRKPPAVARARPKRQSGPPTGRKRAPGQGTGYIQRGARRAEERAGGRRCAAGSIEHQLKPRDPKIVDPSPSWVVASS